MPEEQELLFNINLGILIRAKYPPKKRAARAVKFVKAFVRRHAKVPEDYRIKVRPELNELLWSQGAGNPPSKLRVRVVLNEEDEEAVIWPA